MTAPKIGDIVCYTKPPGRGRPGGAKPALRVFPAIVVETLEHGALNLTVFMPDGLTVPADTVIEGGPLKVRTWFWRHSAPPDE